MEWLFGLLLICLACRSGLARVSYPEAGDSRADRLVFRAVAVIVGCLVLWVLVLVACS